MKTYRLTYEETDTNNKENNIKISKEYCLTDKEYNKLLLPEQYVNWIKLVLWEYIHSRISPNYFKK